MASYTARFTLTLQRPIATSEQFLQTLIITPASGYVTRVEIIPAIDERKRVHKMHIVTVYSGNDLSLCYSDWAKNPSPHCGIVVTAGTVILMPPVDVTVKFIVPLLNCISALTLQAHIYFNIEENLKDHISNFTWTLPDGNEVPQWPDDIYPKYWLMLPADLWGRPLEISDWIQAQDIGNGIGQHIPLWRTILINAHREQNNDIRNTIVQCATALEIGVTPYLKGADFNVNELNKKPFKLKVKDKPLYEAVSRLWYTRIAIVHRGEAMIYEVPPRESNEYYHPARPIRLQDIYEFLRAVPKCISLVENCVTTASIAHPPPHS